jgi:DNA-binding response OmpR family regulator
MMISDQETRLAAGRARWRGSLAGYDRISHISPGPEHGKKPVVLVVDDEPGVTSLVMLTLQDEGFEVLTAADGLAALESIERREPDALVLDLNLPGMDGWTLFRALRARHVDVPVLILSACGARDAQRELGAEDALDKPFDVDELARSVGRLVASKIG